MDNQIVYMSGNKYSILSAMKGALLYWTENTQEATVVMEREQINMIFGGLQGAITVNPVEPRLSHLYIYNSNFTNMYAKEGSAINVQNLGKLYLEGCNFNQTSLFKNSQEKYNYIVKNF
jgi:hypothetical protein